MMRDVSATASPRSRPQFRLGNDSGQSCDRIVRWSRLLAIVGILSVLVSAGIAFALGVSANEAIEIALAFLLAVSAVVMVVPTILMFQMSHLFGKVAFPANAASLIAPMRALRGVLMWFVGIAAVGHVTLLLIAAVNLVGTGFGFLMNPQARTIESMTEVAIAIDEYALREHDYPAADSYDGLLRILGRDGGDDRLPAVDGWKRPFKYEGRADRMSGPSYTLSSYGADGARQEGWRTHGDEKPVRPADVDIVLKSGVFVEGPADILGPVVRRDER
jgi:hypothetical protein